MRRTDRAPVREPAGPDTDDKTPLQAQRIDLEGRVRDGKQRRIDHLESLLLEFRDGLQELLAEATRKTEALREAEAQRERLTALLASNAARIAELTRRCELLEKEARGDLVDQAIEFATTQIDRLTRDEAAAAGEMKRIREAREQAERYLAATARRERPAPSSLPPVQTIVERLARR